MEKELISSMESNTKGFDYSAIPLGYYDHIANEKKGMRSFWHYLKFKRVIDSLEKDAGSILDIGCFAGTFLGMIPESRIKEQVGIDILEEQINYAKQRYGTGFRKFLTLAGFENNSALPDNHFDYITCIEVIEHLTQKQVEELFTFSINKLRPGGKFIFTTPNYVSLWPFLEVFLNCFSDVKYEEQHITKFNYLNVLKKLERIMPGFYENFRPVFKTTTHLVTPFIAGVSFGLANKISSAVSPSNWKIPLGALLLVELEKI